MRRLKTDENEEPTLNTRADGGDGPQQCEGGTPMGRAQTPRAVDKHEQDSHRTIATAVKSSRLRTLIALSAICLTAVVAVAISHGATPPDRDDGERFEQVRSNLLVGKTDAHPHEATVRNLARVPTDPPTEPGNVMVSLVGLPPNAVVIFEDKVVHSPLLLPRGHYTVTLDITAASHSKIKAVFVPNRSKTIDLTDLMASAALMPKNKEQLFGPPQSAGAIPNALLGDSKTDQAAGSSDAPSPPPAESPAGW